MVIAIVRAMMVVIIINTISIINIIIISTIA